MYLIIILLYFTR